MRGYLLAMAVVWLSFAGKAQEATGEDFVRLGLENVRVKVSDGDLWMAYEDNVYRGTFRGILEVLQVALERPDVTGDIRLVVLENRVPQVGVEVAGAVVRDYKQGVLSLRQVMERVSVSYDTGRVMWVLSRVRPENRSAGKIDVVLYPQLFLSNSTYNRLYEVTVNISPAIEMALWRGASFIGQVLFPLYNTRDEQADYIRPGILAIRQDVRFPGNWFASLSVGNFTDYRMGVDASAVWRAGDGRWAVDGDIGLTGASTFYRGKWELSRWKRWNGSLGIQFNEPRYHLQMDLKAMRYIYGDYGVRADCTRHWGEVAVGLFAMYTGGEVNGGFHLAIPLPRRKRGIRKAVRVRLPEYFDWEYQAQSGNEYVEKALGRDFETRPDENRSGWYYNPGFIKDNLIRLTEK